MSLNGEEIIAPYRKWLEAEVASLTALRTDLGKFFFGVSTGTVAVLVSLEKVGVKVSADGIIYFSLAAFLISMIIALAMVKPPVWSITSETDLFDEHDGQVDRLVKFAGWWFAVWLLALAPWLYRVFTAPALPAAVPCK